MFVGSIYLNKFDIKNRRLNSVCVEKQDRKRDEKRFPSLRWCVLAAVYNSSATWQIYQLDNRIKPSKAPLKDFVMFLYISLLKWVLSTYRRDTQFIQWSGGAKEKKCEWEWDSVLKQNFIGARLVLMSAHEIQFYYNRIKKLAWK